MSFRSTVTLTPDSRKMSKIQSYVNLINHREYFCSLHSEVEALEPLIGYFNGGINGV